MSTAMPSSLPSSLQAPPPLFVPLFVSFFVALFVALSGSALASMSVWTISVLLLFPFSLYEEWHLVSEDLEDDRWGKNDEFNEKRFLPVSVAAARC